MIQPSYRRTLVSPRLLAAMGLGSLAIAACGAQVVVDAEATDGSGGSSGNGGAGGMTSGFGGGGFGGFGGIGPFMGAEEGSGAGTPGCAVQASPPEQLIQICAAFGCPDGGGLDAGALESQLAQFIGLCDPITSPCCGVPTLEQVVCGPDTSTGLCCYEGIMSPMHTCGAAPVHAAVPR
jgi:hypothetical protein